MRVKMGEVARVGRVGVNALYTLSMLCVGLVLCSAESAQDATLRTAGSAALTPREIGLTLLPACADRVRRWCCV